MSTPQIQQSFNAGEISPELYGEVSLNKYSSAATTMRNMFASYKGGAVSRGGLAFIGRCKQPTTGAPPRPIPFQFSITQGYILEFGDNYVRFVFQGGYVLEAGVTITGATQANPCQISVAGTPFSNGDWVFISGVGGMTQLNGNTYIVAGVAAGHFTLQDLNGNAVNSTTYGTYTSGGSAFRIYTIASPYVAADLPYLKFSQSADVMTLACSNPVTSTEYAPYSLVRLSATNWTLTPTSFTAAISAPTGLTATSQSSQILSTYYSYIVTAVDSITGEESVASSVVSVQNNDIAVYQGTNTITWTAVAGAGSYNVYKAIPSYGQPVPIGSIFGLMTQGVLGTSAIDTNITPDFQQSPPLHENPFARGQILDIVPTAAGTNYSQTTIGYSLGSTGGGSGFTGSPVVNNGGLGGFYITNNGHDYPPGVTVSFSDSGGGLATGNFVGAANPADGDQVIINDVPIKFRRSSTAPGYNETPLGATLALTMQSLSNFCNASTDVSLTCATYTYDATHLYITYKTPGAVGNAFKLDASTSGFTRSAATLTGGGTAGAGATGTVTVGAQSGTYPGVPAYFQQRQFFANSFNNPDTFWASKTGSYRNFDTSVPVTATDAITATPWTEQVNGIQWLVPMPGGLIAMTGNRAWQIVGEGSYQLNVQPITPSTTQAQPQAFNGCSATLPPQVIDYDVIYREAVNNVIRDFSWNLALSIYTGNDLTILASHLFETSGITQWAWARAPYKLLWGCREDGTMLALTYLKEQEVYAWTRHDTAGLVVGMASVTEPPVNAVYTVTQRFLPSGPSTGIYCMERMDNRLWQSVEDAYAVDSGVSNPMSSPTTFVYASAATGSVTFTAGAAAFTPSDVGRILRMGGGIATITGYTDNKHVTGTWNLAASNGAIGLPFSSSGTWTLATPIVTIQAMHLANSTGLVGLLDGVPVAGLSANSLGNISLPFTASDVKVGIGFTAQLQTAYLNDPRIQGLRKVTSEVVIRVAGSASGFQVGTNQPDGAVQNPPQLAPTWANMSSVDTAQSGSVQPAAPTYTSPGGQIVTQLWTGDRQQTVVGDWLKPGQIAIQQTLPVALEITAIIPRGLEGDTPEQTYQPKSGGSGPGKGMIQGARL